MSQNTQHTLKTMGDLEGGISAYKKARKLKPNIGEISFSLSNLKTFRFSDLEIEDMKRRLNNPKLDKPSKVAFSFSLGKSYEDSGDYDEAFQYYKMGNEIQITINISITRKSYEFQVTNIFLLIESHWVTNLEIHFDIPLDIASDGT